MIWFFWVLSPVLIALAYLFAAPIYVEINTAVDLFRVRFHRLVSAALLITGDGILIDLKVAWWEKRFDLLAPGKKGRPKKTKPVEKTARRRRISFRTTWAVLKTFKVKSFYLTADTGNPAFNGAIYPAFYAIRTLTGQNISINFGGRNELVLEIKNNLARITRAFIYSSLKSGTWKT
ncbi:MAG: hypothetical protein JSU01_09820 [Bacteroidetes bacterium]|nr:hypothetical protein [Bacteroidota bacterium]